MAIETLRWDEGILRILDQRHLPQRVAWVEVRSATQVAAAIRDMVVRGAPAIGVAAAYGMALAARNGEDLELARRELAASRPTAVNLFWALERMASAAEHGPDSALDMARRIEADEVERNLAIGQHGSALVPSNAQILTICNTGSLATPGIGTALGVIRTAHALGKVAHVFACETRPRQQGLRLTAWELTQDGIPFSVLADGAAGHLMRTQHVSLVVAGADRIARNGDTANKIGTYSLAVLAQHHGVPFYIAAPTSTIDVAAANGADIVVEERDPEELTHFEGVAVAPPGCPVWNPAFDVTPGELITGIVTETGVMRRPYRFEK